VFDSYDDCVDRSNTSTWAFAEMVSAGFPPKLNSLTMD
jgi:hypothetical protein